MGELYSKILPIKLQKDYNLILGYALPLCVILADNKFEGWYYENYTMPYVLLKGIEYFECGILDAIEYGGRDNINTRLMRYSYVGKNIMSQVSNIYSIIKERIQEDFYCILFLDDYHLSKMYTYHKKHFAHEVLIYGYNDYDRQYYGVSFINGNFESFIISYEEMDRAYYDVFSYIDERDGWGEKMFMQLRCVGHTKAYPVNIDKFKNKIRNYSLSLLEESDYYLHLFYMKEGESEIAYGIKITDTFLKYIILMKEYLIKAQTDKEVKKIFEQYFPFHMYADFHKGIYKRFQFYGQGILKQEDLEEYKKISLKTEKIRMSFIKLSIIAEVKNKDKILRILDNIEEDFIYIKDNEKLICEKIISLL